MCSIKRTYKRKTNMHIYDASNKKQPVIIIISAVTSDYNQSDLECMGLIKDILI